MAASAVPAAAIATVAATPLAAMTLTDALFAGAARCDGFAARRRLAVGFLTDLRADLADLVAFFLVPAVALEVLPADFVLVLLIRALYQQISFENELF
jgi:hypothetical protein